MDRILKEITEYININGKKPDVLFITKEEEKELLELTSFNAYVTEPLMAYGVKLEAR